MSMNSIPLMPVSADDTVDAELDVAELRHHLAALDGDAYADAVREAKKTYELSRGLYEAGSVDYQTMLEAERTLLNANDNYATVKFELLSAAVDLYRALGGGWKVK